MNDGGGVGPDGLGCDLRGGCEIRTREAARRGMPFDIMDDDDDDIGCGGVRDSVLSSSAITSSVSSRDVAIRGVQDFIGNLFTCGQTTPHHLALGLGSGAAVSK